MKDLDKRRRVMQRSIRLGHCVCDPKKPCPCDLLKEKDVCLCAGERLEVAAGPIRLTKLVDSPGCASKIDQVSLLRVLEGLPALDDPRVLVGSAAGDDAGVFRFNGEEALVETVDVFAPSVDDPYTFGQIAAANSLSDVYAMGGRALVALSIVAFPIREVPEEVMREILRGGIEKMAEAGVPVVGGHSINDPQIKAGFAVTGLVRPEAMVTNAGARPGDRLVLTKPLGVGITAFAAQIGRASDAAVAESARWMATLNRRAAEAMVEFGATAATDVTGFGLMGHLGSMARASGVDVEVTLDELPLLPDVLQCAADGILPGGIERNRESALQYVANADEVPPAMLEICFDAQTSGGLLVAMPEENVEAFLARLHEEDGATAAVIGRVVEAGSGTVRLVHTGKRPLPEPREYSKPSPSGESPTTSKDAGAALRHASATPTQPVGSTVAEDDECCCPEPADSPTQGAVQNDSPVTAIEQSFQTFMRQSGAPGALDVATKQSINIALSVLAKCEPCIKAHLKKARAMGFSQEEIDEAAWMAISFGGSPTMMFWKQHRREG
ncbi:MAG: selenide, water dikinase SelD [Pirellulales bacterium]|nr:selenide, water dikinase SelD [Pirellulales bacterium]